MKNLRYVDGGQTFPQEIESFVVTFLRNGERRKPCKLLIREQTYGEHKKDYMNLIRSETNENGDSATVVLINGVRQEVIFRQVMDTRRSTLSDPVREVLWEGNTYRTVPFNGDLRQHHPYQTSHFDKKFFP
jgi:hypothetical protein